MSQTENEMYISMIFLQGQSFKCYKSKKILFERETKSYTEMSVEDLFILNRVSKVPSFSFLLIQIQFNSNSN